MICFIMIPLLLIGVVFVKFKWDAIATEENEIKTQRLGSPVEFDESKMFELRDDKLVSKEIKEDGPEIEMGQKEDGNNLEDDLATNAD